MAHRRDISDREALAAARRWQQAPSGQRPDGVYRVLAATYPPKVVLAKLEHLVDRGLLEYGVSVSYGWPTEEGLALLAALAVPQPPAGGEHA